MSGKKLPSPRGIQVNTTTLSTEEDQAKGGASTARRITLEDNSYMDTALSQSMISKKPMTRTL